MGLYNEKKDYQELVSENIAKAKLLSSIPSENREKVIELLNQKDEIIKENSIFAGFKLRKINKQIEKLKK